MVIQILRYLELLSHNPIKLKTPKKFAINIKNILNKIFKIIDCPFALFTYFECGAIIISGVDENTFYSIIFRFRFRYSFLF